MKVNQIVELGIIKDDTEVIIRDEFKMLAHGNWYQDNVLKYADAEAEAFTWQDDGKVYIDLPHYTKEQVQEVKAALESLGYGTEHIELESIDDVSCKVIYGGHLILGVYHFNSHTFE